MVNETPEAQADRRDVEALIGWLAGRDEACPVCGHNLRDACGAVCAECGSPLLLSITSSRLRPGPWLLAFGSFVLAFGFDAVTTVLMLIPLGVSIYQQGTVPPLDYWVLLAMLAMLSVLTAGGAWLLLKKRPAWPRMTRGGQRLASLGVFGGVGAVHLAAGTMFVLWVM